MRWSSLSCAKASSMGPGRRSSNWLSFAALSSSHCANAARKLSGTVRSLDPRATRSGTRALENGHRRDRRGTPEIVAKADFGAVHLIGGFAAKLLEDLD